MDQTHLGMYICKRSHSKTLIAPGGRGGGGADQRQTWGSKLGGHMFFSQISNTFLQEPKA